MNTKNCKSSEDYPRIPIGENRMSFKEQQDLICPDNVFHEEVSNTLFSDGNIVLLDGDLNTDIDDVSLGIVEDDSLSQIKKRMNNPKFMEDVMAENNRY